MKEIFKHIIVALITFEARILIARKRPKIVGITGSVGKTSTKDAVYTVLSNRVRVRKSEKSFNSEIGVPLTILGLPNAWSNPVRWVKNIIEGLFVALFTRDYPEWLVLEIGVDRPGDIARLTTWIKPDIVILTRLPDVPVHVEFFSSPEAVIAEKRKLVDALKQDGVLIFNNDDERVVRVKEETRQQSVGFSRYSLSPFTASADTVVYENGRPVGLEFTLTHGTEASIIRVEGSLGVQHAYSYAAAVAVGSIFGMSIDECARILRGHVPPPGRMRLIPGIKGSMIIDDTYNASPVAMERAIQTLKEVRTVGHKIALLGDMMELGQYSVREHEKIGAQIADVADILVTIGIRARGIAEGALDHGMQESKIYQYEDARRAGKELEAILGEDDIVLVKGSQSIRGERAVEEIMAEPMKASELLVRQDPMWQRI
jgi:UDP-N-acetylmuramoyl-tripeptide--D-alanyl-D-alanine ligase